MVTRAKLKNYLLSRLTLDGRMTVSRSILKEGKFPNSTQKHQDTLLRMMKPEEKCQVKDLIRENFYSNALVPKALKLRDTWPNFEYLENELDLMLDSPANVIITNLKEELIGAVVNTIWLVDPEYEAFPVDPLEWLNVSGEIAQETTKDPLYRAVIWRNYQFMLIYHMTQSLAQKQGLPYYLYGGMGFTQPEYRDRGGTLIFMSFCHQWAKSENSLFFNTGTYPGFMKMIDKKLSGMFRQMAYMPYDKLGFQLHDNAKPAFSDLTDGMVLMVSS